ncbi:helix-turn-helix domain-containing protein [Streptomyces aureocirculatus]|uniref:helix-turn-helix domain-containing protein n=1 Tax=Streptomyces aureocirculatus TaxID=67275 RepID=UPI0012FF331D|nr:helix-turn-helix transcriptional regulator [Streptomyces aureocirculatus]
MNTAYGPGMAVTELLPHLVTLRTLLEELTGATVVLQRSRGQSLDEAAHFLDRTKDRLRKKYPPHTVDAALSARTRPHPQPHNDTPLPDTPPRRPQDLRAPRQRLASALTRMARQSEQTQRKLATLLAVDPSYVSRMLSGYREVSWQHVKTICDACNHSPDLIKPLWEAASSAPLPTTDTVRYLRTYLRALRYAANYSEKDAEKGAEKILSSLQLQHAITTADLRQAFHGPGVPTWPVVQQIAAALQSQPEIARRLWRLAHAETEAHGGTETCGISAAAFG